MKQLFLCNVGTTSGWRHASVVRTADAGEMTPGPARGALMQPAIASSDIAVRTLNWVPKEIDYKLIYFI